MTTDVLTGWEKSTFTAAGFTRDVYRRGTGPGVVVVHEIPGITPKVTEFANDVVAAGFTVLMPSLVGTPGKSPSGGYMASSMSKVCVSKEFTNWAMNQTSPIIAWLRAVARNLHQELGGPGVGAVGMCFSGGFALAMMVDDIMVAPVLSQPSMPFATENRSCDASSSPCSPARWERSTSGSKEPIAATKSALVTARSPSPAASRYVRSSSAPASAAPNSSMLS